jgi:hypothetical protein
MTGKILTKGNRRSLKSIIIIALVFNCINSELSFGQELQRDKPLLKDRLFYGGSFGLQIGTITNIEVSPVVGIWLLPRVAIAGGPSYQFYKDPYYRTNIYGGRMYFQYVVIQDVNNIIPVGINLAIFLHGEYEGLSLENNFWNNTNLSSQRFMIHTLLGGAGINQSIGRRSSVNLMVLWALTADDYGVYNNPEIRVGFNF